MPCYIIIILRDNFIFRPSRVCGEAAMSTSALVALVWYLQWHCWGSSYTYQESAYMYRGGADGDLPARTHISQAASRHGGEI